MTPNVSMGCPVTQSLRIRCWFLTVLVALPLLGCGTEVVPSLLGSSAADRPERRWIDPIRTSMGITGRSVLTCAAGDCIVLHYPPLPVAKDNLRNMLELDPDTPADEVELCEESWEEWYAPSPLGVTLNTFNCCTFAVADVVGLTRNDWVRPSATGDTYYTVPMQVILESYFHPVRTYHGPVIPWGIVEEDDQLREDDVLCYTRTDLPAIQFAHVGKIVKVDGRNRLLSKYGSGPIVRTSLELLGNVLVGEFDEIQVYRRNDAQL